MHGEARQLRGVWVWLRGLPDACTRNSIMTFRQVYVHTSTQSVDWHKACQSEEQYWSGMQNIDTFGSYSPGLETPAGTETLWTVKITSRKGSHPDPSPKTLKANLDNTSKQRFISSLHNVPAPYTGCELDRRDFSPSSLSHR